MKMTSNVVNLSIDMHPWQEAFEAFKAVLEEIPICASYKNTTFEPTGKALITGGTGSLGQALLKRAEEEGWDVEFTILSRDESKQAETRKLYPQHHYILGDVAKWRDVQRAVYDQDYVFHFAAYKRVPSAQNNVAATIETNVIGSQNIVDASIQAGVKQVVASSTDKATNPANSYGASKYLMESIFQNGNRQKTATTFHLARYGNVICSNASVIPLFVKQTKLGGPLTVTHKEMTRFWITLDDAIDLILTAMVHEPGTIIVPQAGAKSVFDIAKLVGGDLPIKEIGIRPGEKIHEAMVSEAESFYTEGFDDYFVIYPPTSGEIICETPWEYTSEYADEIPNTLLKHWIEEYS